MFGVVAYQKVKSSHFDYIVCVSGIRHLNVFLCSVEEEVDAVVEVAVRREAVPGVAVSVELGLLARVLTMHLSIIPYSNPDLTIFTMIKRSFEIPRVGRR